ncbi:carbohydrate esterase family 4 protein [Lactarius indigo]|nr:carbohydrate esterase family 4 protein [Lactarius indigo]
MLFNLRALSPLVVFLATSALAQDHSSEQSEAQISGARPLPLTHQSSTFLPPTLPPQIPISSARRTTTLPRASSSTPSLRYGSPRRFSRMTPRARPCGPKSRRAFRRTFLPKGQLNGSTINVTYDTVNDPDCSVPEPKTMGYGFDDGPNCTHNAFYNFLSSQNQKATMYYIGSNVLDWPLEAQRAIADGHEICAREFWLVFCIRSELIVVRVAWQILGHIVTSQDAFAELWYTIKAIKLVTGVTPTCWRPPYGDVDGNITATDVDNNYNLFISNLTSGAFDTVGGIMLTHELNNFTMQEAIKWYPQLKAAFSAIVPIGVALNKTQPYKETNYSLPTFEQYVSGQVTASGSNSSGSGTGTGSGSSPTSSSSTGSGSTKSSSARTHVVHGAALWTVLCATGASRRSSCYDDSDG